jgi:signal transduction histidine kinase
VIGPLLWVVTVVALHLEGRRRLTLVARAGHDVRGPLCTARLALDGLEPCARVNAIELELRRAALALDDLAAAGRGRRAGGRWEAVDLGRLLAAAAPAWHALARARSAELTVDGEGVRVAGDALRLAQACANLVANAVEHGGGRVDVRVAADGDRARVEVADDGPGLPAPLPHLLAAARGRRTPRGHGLAIVAGIAERHRGRLLSLPSDRGARLVLDLPAAPNARFLRRPRLAGSGAHS